MPNPEEQLKSIRTRALLAPEREIIWQAILAQKETRRPLLTFFRITFMAPALIILVLLFGGGGLVAASNDARPGDTLFSLDLAAERARLAFAPKANRSHLAVQFAQERLGEIRDLQEQENTTVSSASQDLSGLMVSEIEVDIFTDQTIIKIEANDQKFGFVSDARTETAIITEISNRYNIPEATVARLITLEVENRASRPDDIDFSLDRTDVVIVDTNELRITEASLRQTLRALEASGTIESGENAELRRVLQSLLMSLEADGKIEIEFQNGEVEIESEDGIIKVEFEDEEGDDNSGHGNDDDGFDEDNPGNSSGTTSGGNSGNDNSGNGGTSAGSSDDDNSGGSNSLGDDEDDNGSSSSGGGSDDNSGSGSSNSGGNDDHSSSGNDGDDDHSSNSGSGNNDDDDDNSGPGGN